MRRIPAVDGGIFFITEATGSEAPGPSSKGASRPSHRLLRMPFLASDLAHSNAALSMHDEDGYMTMFTRQLITSTLTVELESGDIVNVINGDAPVPEGEESATTRGCARVSDDSDIEDDADEARVDDGQHRMPGSSHSARCSRPGNPGHPGSRAANGIRPDTVTLQRTDEIINCTSSRPLEPSWAVRTGTTQMPSVSSFTARDSHGTARQRLLT